MVFNNLIKKVGIFAGGHGAQTLIDFILENPTVDFMMIFNVFDNGGHTGVLSHMYGGSLPMGDLRNNLVGWIKHLNIENGETIASILNHRVKFDPANPRPEEDIHGFSEIETKIAALFDNLELQHGVDLINIKTSMMEFLEDYKVRYAALDEEAQHEAYGDGTRKIPHSIGNIFVHGLIATYGLEAGVSILKDTLKWVPENVEIEFMHSKRLTLEITDIDGRTLRGEKHLDNEKVIFPGKNYKIIEIEEGEIERLDIAEKIAERDVIIKPVGSSVNAVPAINYLIKELLGKPIINIVNIMKHETDESFFSEAAHLAMKGLQVLHLVPKSYNGKYKDGQKGSVGEEVMMEYRRSENKVPHLKATDPTMISAEVYDEVYKALTKYANEAGVKIAEAVIAKIANTITENVEPVFNIEVHLGTKMNGDYVDDLGFRHNGKELSEILMLKLGIEQTLETSQEFRPKHIPNESI